MAQTIEGFVGTSLDDARMSPIHWRVFALIAAGYFFDVADYVILGSLIPDMMRSGFATAAADRHRGQRHAVRAVRRHAGTGRVHRPLRPQDGVSVQPAAVRSGDDRGGVLAQLHLARRAALHRRHRSRRRTAAVLCLCRRVRAEEHPRPLHRRRADDRRRLVMAAVHPVRTRRSATRSAGAASGSSSVRAR